MNVHCLCGGHLSDHGRDVLRCTKCRRVMTMELRVVDGHTLADRNYDRYVEAPRRAGRDPVWDSLLAQALAESTPNQPTAVPA